MAVQDWEKKTASLRSLSQKYGVHHSHIIRWSSIKKEAAEAKKTEEAKEYLNEDEKQELGNYFRQLHKFGIDFVSSLCYQISVPHGINVPVIK